LRLALAETVCRQGVDGLRRDTTRPSRIPKPDPSIAERVAALTREALPHEATHWTGAATAEAVGVSVGSMQRIWRTASSVRFDPLGGGAGFRPRRLYWR